MVVKTNSTHARIMEEVETAAALLVGSKAIGESRWQLGIQVMPQDTLEWIAANPTYVNRYKQMAVKEIERRHKAHEETRS